MTDPLVWLFIWVFGLGFLGLKQGPLVAVQGALLGFALWLFFGFFWFIGGALSTNSCEEYGHPDLADTSNGETCSDEELRKHIENE